MSKAELTLRTWGVPEEEIDAVKEEARAGLRTARGSATSKSKRSGPRSRSGRRSTAPSSRKDVNVGKIVDTAFDLFKVADLRKLGVMVHAYEEDLRELQSCRRLPVEGSRRRRFSIGYSRATAYSKSAWWSIRRSTPIRSWAWWTTRTAAARRPVRDGDGRVARAAQRGLPAGSALDEDGARERHLRPTRSVEAALRSAARVGRHAAARCRLRPQRR